MDGWGSGGHCSGASAAPWYLGEGIGGRRERRESCRARLSPGPGRRLRDHGLRSVRTGQCARLCVTLLAAPPSAAPDPARLPAGGDRLRDGRAGARRAQFDDQQVKAAFVLNFLKFVTWPAPAAGRGPDRRRRARRRRPGPGPRRRPRPDSRSAAAPIVVRAVRRPATSAPRRTCSSSAPPSATACPSCCASSKAARC